jgi:hypothetical protein
LPEFVTDWIWILWYENQNCQIVWSWHTPLPPFLLFQSPSLLCPFFLSCQIWHPVGRFLQTKWTKPANQQLQSCRYFTYLLTYLLLCPQSFWQNRTGSDVCVCVCVCVFFFFVFLSLSNHLSWRVCNLMTFFCWFSLHLLTTNSLGILQYRSTATDS